MDNDGLSTLLIFLGAALVLGLIEILLAYGMLAWARKITPSNPRTALRLYNVIRILALPRAGFYMQRGWIYHRLGKHQNALKDFNDAIARKPKNAEAYYLRGRIYIALEKPEKAIKDFSKAITLKPDYARAYSSRALAYNRFFKEYEKAVSDASRAIELQPDYLPAYPSRALAYIRLGKLEEAVQDYDHCIELEPTSAQAYTMRGWLHLRLKHYQQAFQDFDRSIANDPSHVNAYIYRGLAYYGISDYKSALDDFQKAIAITPENKDAYLGRGAVRFRQGEYQEALHDYNQVLALEPASSMGYFGRGWAHLGLRQIDQARADIEKSCELDSNFTGVHWALAWLDMSEMESKPGVEMAERLENIALRESDYPHLVWVCRGTAHWLRGASKEALADFDQSLELETQEEDAYFWKAMAYISLHRDEDAIAAIDQSLAIGFPPVLLSPLRWFAVERPDFYEQYVVPLLDRSAH